MSKIVAIVGTYRIGGITDQAVDAVLEGARQSGAKVRKISLIDQHIEFCRNCRMCTQQPGPARGECVHDDDLDFILREVESASGVILAAPVNYYNVTALFRRFMERLIGYAWWPWGQRGPTLRTLARTRKAVLVTSASLPGFLIPLATGAPRALKLTAKMVGARPVGQLWIGGAAVSPDQQLTPRLRARALRLGKKLAQVV